MSGDDPEWECTGCGQRIYRKARYEMADDRHRIDYDEIMRRLKEMAPLRAEQQRGTNYPGSDHHRDGDIHTGPTSEDTPRRVQHGEFARSDPNKRITVDRDGHIHTEPAPEGKPRHGGETTGEGPSEKESRREMADGSRRIDFDEIRRRIVEASGGRVTPYSNNSNEQPSDPRRPAELSLEELVRGEGSGYHGRSYERALLDRLRELAAKAAFAEVPGDPFDNVIAKLPGYNRLATERVLPNNRLDAGEGASNRSVVIKAPEPFPHDLYILSFLLPPPERQSPVVTADEEAAKEAWHSEKPVFIDSSASLPEVFIDRSERLYFPDSPPGHTSATPAPEDDTANLDGSDRIALENWYKADPGSGDYERRITGYWHLQPASSYLIRMNFLEDISEIDFHGPDGLIWLYPRANSNADSGFQPVVDEDDHVGAVTGQHPKGRGFDPNTGALSIHDCAEALALASVMGERFHEQGVICEPEVMLTEPSGRDFKLDPPWREKKKDFAEERAIIRERSDAAREVLGHDGYAKPRMLRGLSSVVPSDEDGWIMIEAVKSYLLSHNRIEKLAARLADNRIPERRKTILRRELHRMEESRSEALHRVGAQSLAMIGLIASLNKEREILYDTLRLRVQQWSESPPSFPEFCLPLSDTRLEEIKELWDEDSSHYG